jgi:hypothetical protein
MFRILKLETVDTYLTILRPYTDAEWYDYSKRKTLHTVDFKMMYQIFMKNERNNQINHSLESL